jgi:hypothetical protein
LQVLLSLLQRWYLPVSLLPLLEELRIGAHRGVSVSTLRRSARCAQ